MKRQSGFNIEAVFAVAILTLPLSCWDSPAVSGSRQPTTIAAKTGSHAYNTKIKLRL